jgi:hypothetical protein
MATTTNYGWTTPDDTALVKDGAAAIRTLGTSIDTTTKNLNPSTTLGDIQYRSSTSNTNTRLGIGSTGQVLTVAGGVPSWATPGGAVPSFSLLNAGGTALTGSTEITISGISGQNQLFLQITDASSANANSSFFVRLNGDTAGNYTSFGGRVQSAPEAVNNLDTTAGLLLCAMSNSDTSAASASLLLTGCNSTGFKVGMTAGGSSSAGGNNGQSVSTGGIYKGTSVITSISVRSSTGNFDGGTLYVYGSAV